MTLNLYFLGPPRIERDGRVVETDTRKAVALLVYLAVTGQYQTRDTLAALLWPEMDDERARAALRRTLSSLRAAVGDEAIYVHRDGLSLNEANVWCDITAIETTLAEVTHHDPATPCPECLTKMEAAIALYRDHFLSGFTLRDSAVFDDWQSATTEHLRRVYTTALAWLVQAHVQAAGYERAIEHARRWLAVDPLREEAHRRLMQLYAWSGARESALRQYREAVRVLDDELGVGPLNETTELYEAIQEGRLAPPTAPPVEPLAPEPGVETKAPPGTVPLIGREAAWSELQHAYGDVNTTGRLAAVIGEAGIGKTRLVEAFLEEIRARGATTATATCYEGEANLAYAPIAAGLRALLRRPEAAGRLAAIPAHWLAEAARLVPEIGGPADPTAMPAQSPGAQARFFAGISETLCHLLSGELPGVLFLDDLHWSDEASLDLLAYLARRLSDLPILLILSWADDAGTHAPNGRRLRRLLADAQRAGTGRLIHLTRWRPSDVLSLVMDNPRLRGRATELTDRLYRETEGLPFFVIEYLAALDESANAWPMPQSVRELLAGRWADVDQTGRQLLQTAAVIGRSFDYSTLLEASGRSEEEVIGGLERLLAQGLIRELGDQPLIALRYDFAHPLLRSLVYDETNLARRRLLHRRVAAALQAGAREQQGNLSGLVADHYHLGGQEANAAEFYRRAGDHARALYANREALGHFRTALALGHPDAPALHEAAGDLHTLLGEYQAALQAYESAAAAQTTPDDLGRLEQKLGQVYERRGNWELAESHYCAALDRLRPIEHPAELALLNVDRSRVVYRRGDLAQAQALGQEALAQAQAAADPQAEAQAHNTLGILARQSSQTADARAHLERSLALAEASGNSAARVAALNNLAHLLESDGDGRRALELLDQALALCVREGDRHREAALHNHRADILHRAAQDEAAMSSLKQAVAIYAEIGLEAGDWQPEIWKLTEW